MKLLDSAAVCDLLGISKSTLYRWCDVADAPSPLSLAGAAAARSVEVRSAYLRSGFADMFAQHMEETPKDVPRPFKIGRAYKWRDDEILNWLETRRV